MANGISECVPVAVKYKRQFVFYILNQVFAHLKQNLDLIITVCNNFVKRQGTKIKRTTFRVVLFAFYKYFFLLAFLSIHQSKKFL